MNVDDYKITEKDMAGKGVSPQPNPMELPEAEAKAVFDQLVKEVVVPFFNKFVEAFANVDLTSDADKPISTATQEALDKKVDKAYKTGSQSEYKVLSDNNFDDNSKENLALATRDRHTHANKNLLDKFTQAFIDNILFKDNEEEYFPTNKFNPATVDYVDRKVIAIGAADMQKSIYDPNGKETDIFAYIDNAVLITDSSTGDKYFLGIDGGGLFLEKVDEAALVARHNADAAAHDEMVIDGNAIPASSGETLAEHEVNPDAHRNLSIDGNR